MIADIQRASFHDGEGIRTTVFFKGCPLQCRWCHNPECISFEQQVLQYPEKCIGCGRCDEGCFSGAKEVCGREYDPKDLLAEILQDKPYYGEFGGVTFSGGEPLAQREFLSEMIDLCKAEGLNCAVETSLIYFDEEIFKKLDTVMADLKIWNSAIHRTYTGVGNEQIKENFRRLNDLGVPILARTPLIPGVRQEMDRISAFLKTLCNVKQYEILPYHPLGLQKAMALGIEQERFSVPDDAMRKEVSRYAFLR